ncbi:hypothetical protein AAC387_Pa05g2960 [Persea americana]
MVVQRSSFEKRAQYSYAGYSIIVKCSHVPPIAFDPPLVVNNDGFTAKHCFPDWRITAAGCTCFKGEQELLICGDYPERGSREEEVILADIKRKERLGPLLVGTNFGQARLGLHKPCSFIYQERNLGPGCSLLKVHQLKMSTSIRGLRKICLDLLLLWFNITPL